MEHFRLNGCVGALWSMQSNSRFASYEKTRGGDWHLELLNPTEIFEQIMVEHSCPIEASSINYNRKSQRPKVIPIKGRSTVVHLKLYSC